MTKPTDARRALAEMAALWGPSSTPSPTTERSNSMDHPSFKRTPDGEYWLSPGAILWQGALTAYAPLGGEHGSESPEGRDNARRFVMSVLAAASAAGMPDDAVRQLQRVAERVANHAGDIRSMRDLLAHCERAAAHVAGPKVVEMFVTAMKGDEP